MCYYVKHKAGNCTEGRNVMKKFCKICILGVICCILTSFNICFASDGSLRETDANATSESKTQEMIINELEYIIDPNVTAYIFDEKANTEGSGVTKTDIYTASGKAIDGITGYLYRQSKNGTSVQVYLRFHGSSLTNSIRFKKLTVKSASSLSSTVYATIGNGSSYKTYGYETSSDRFLCVTTIQIPTSVNQTRMISKSLQAYYTSKGYWVSSTDINGICNVK